MRQASYTLGLALGLSLCLQGPAVAASVPRRGDLTKLLLDIPPGKVDSESRQTVLGALALLGKQRFDEGSKQLNAALRLDPANSYLQFFNAYAYHLMGQAGDTQKLLLAEQGYQLAAQFDASNWVAHYFAGLLYVEQRNFRAAQHEFAEVLLSIGEDAEVLGRLVSASYYAGDPVTAAACLERLRSQSPADPQILRLSAIVSAAVNQPDKAAEWQASYQATGPTSASLNQLRERVAHWAVVYRNSERPQAQTVQYGGSDGQSSGFGGQSSLGGMNGTAEPIGSTAQRMVLVDVVIMRTEDAFSTRKGVNLLGALTLQFGSSNNPAYAKSSSTTGNGSADGSSESITTTLLTRGISIPALSYSLNIVNTNSNLNEVLARPTLAALEGVSSEFFSGTTLNAAVVSGNSLGGGGSVQIEKEIGVKLSVLPTFLPGNKIRLVVNAQRTFLKPPSQDVSFTYKLETSKIMVNANVVMEMGETLVLGGLSEKETSNTRDGVPVLQDVPGLQYFFAGRDTNNFQRSVLMLITPRAPQYTYRSHENLAAAGAMSGSDDSMQELRGRYGDWFKPYPNLASVFHQLNSSSLYREFRTGDVTLEKWDKQETTLIRLRQALDFLFY